ncbi:MAG TPA: L,D-transpeptidase, partial [Ancylobacter sp.]
TNSPKSIGTFASYGCVRMLNADIIDLYGRVGVGTSVVMVP